MTESPSSPRRAPATASSRSTGRTGSTPSTTPCTTRCAPPSRRREADESCRALLITGAGRGFCAGQDLSDRLLKPGEKPVPRNSLETYYNPLVRKLRALPFPVIAAVNGVAAGAGCNIALACDIVLAARSASFIAILRAHRARSPIPAAPGCCRGWWARRAPARSRCLAEPLPAEKAEQWGRSGNASTTPRSPAKHSKLCEHFAAAPTQGLALIKRALDASAGNSFDAQLDLERDLQREANMTPDYAEGVRAFMEKRKPNFSGRKSS